MSTAEAHPRADAEKRASDRWRAMHPPDHLGLPESDGRAVGHSLEHPQGQILSDALLPVLRHKHPDGRFALGRDCGIYYRFRPDEPPLSGAIVPDWFHVPDVPPTLDGEYRRSYVLRAEMVPPMIVLEFASGDGSEELDRTPPKGKFWVYERVVRPLYYGIHIAGTTDLRMFTLAAGFFRPLAPDARGHFPIPELGVSLGLWHGVVENLEFPWMRWFDPDGRLLPSGHELAAIESGRVLAESARAQAEAARATPRRPGWRGCPPSCVPWGSSRTPDRPGNRCCKASRSRPDPIETMNPG